MAAAPAPVTCLRALHAFPATPAAPGSQALQGAAAAARERPRAPPAWPIFLALCGSPCFAGLSASRGPGHGKFREGGGIRRCRSALGSRPCWHRVACRGWARSGRGGGRGGGRHGTPAAKCRRGVVGRAPMCTGRLGVCRPCRTGSASPLPVLPSGMHNNHFTMYALHPVEFLPQHCRQTASAPRRISVGLVDSSRAAPSGAALLVMGALYGSTAAACRIASEPAGIGIALCLFGRTAEDWSRRWAPLGRCRNLHLGRDVDRAIRQAPAHPAPARQCVVPAHACGLALDNLHPAYGYEQRAQHDLGQIGRLVV